MLVKARTSGLKLKLKTDAQHEPFSVSLNFSVRVSIGIRVSTLIR